MSNSNMLTSEQRREKNRLVEQAIENSKNAQWQEAVESNRRILELDPDDVQAMNRLGRSLVKLGKLREALETYNNSLKIDAANPIALRNRTRLQILLESVDEHSIATAETPVGFAGKFTMEAGRSALIQLEEPGSPEVLATILPGDGLNLQANGPYLEVVTPSGGHVGLIPHDRAHRLLRLLEAGNEYSVLVVSANADSVFVLVSETYRSPQTQGRLPFPTITRQSAETRETMREIERMSGFDSYEPETEGEDTDSEDEDESTETTVSLSTTNDLSDEDTE